VDYFECQEENKNGVEGLELIITFAASILMTLAIRRSNVQIEFVIAVLCWINEHVETEFNPGSPNAGTQAFNCAFEKRQC
jgi:hypothetical protein